MPRSSYASRVPQGVLRAHVIMGALQIVFGCLVFVLNIIGLTAANELGAEVAFGGLWTGPFFIAAGVSGVVAGKGVRGCGQGCFVTCLVLSILAALLGLCGLIIESSLTFWNAKAFSYYAEVSDQNPNILKDISMIQNLKHRLEGPLMTASISQQPWGEKSMRYYVTNVICTLLFALEFVLAIVHSAFACRASCCCVGPLTAARPDPESQPKDSVYIMLDQKGRVEDSETVQPMLNGPAAYAKPHPA